jgi:hypothetical protein
MNTQIAALAGIVVGLFAWPALPKLRSALRFVSVVALVLACAQMFTRIDLPPYALPALIGAGAVIGLLSLARGL